MFNFWNINLKKTYKKFNAHYATLPSRNKPYKINHIFLYNANFPKKLNAPKNHPNNNRSQLSLIVLSHCVFPGRASPGNLVPRAVFNCFGVSITGPIVGLSATPVSRFSHTFIYFPLFPIPPDFSGKARVYTIMA